jgi:hypothetical protein
MASMADNDVLVIGESLVDIVRTAEKTGICA